MDIQTAHQRFRFGEFELDPEAGELRRNGRKLKLQPQPFKLLLLLVRRPGALVTREEIRQELWADGTFVDFDQSVNFCVKQIRDALRDEPERPIFIQTVPKRGYRFIAPVDTGQQKGKSSDGTTVRLQKVLWANIAELKVAEERRRRNTRIALSVLVVLLLAAVAAYMLR